ncbi:hypothetical protein DFH94DRAFT_688909 [Russula ochroleuca]|uniref:ubiquitinyl hydrolase 1 n=1 Tax=Russula ochroleuca TaxID=152965 RepID=A0A9P5TBU9_9AGAM|nr:hypothetical protein DFH94DRAFT_688904 [Russula ochroleuca]KAF8484499.1 hypothetical protein DFH94DRAFT_688909 [Russula ochroleuca]
MVNSRMRRRFFRLYLDALDEELLALLASSSGQKSVTAPPGGEECESGHADAGNRDSKVELVESPLMCIFGGKFRSTLRAPNQPDTATIEDWRSLQIDIQARFPSSNSTNTYTLARISHVQPVQLGPSGFSEASQQVLIEVLPSILVLHLKRFLHDAAADGIVKISKPVQFAPGLEIPLEIMTPATGKSAEPGHYKLYGVLYHHGESAGSGHYTVDVLHQNGDSGSGEVWLHIDDEAVNTVRHEDVFWGHDNELVDDRFGVFLEPEKLKFDAKVFRLARYPSSVLLPASTCAPPRPAPPPPPDVLGSIEVPAFLAAAPGLTAAEEPAAVLGVQQDLEEILQHLVMRLPVALGVPPARLPPPSISVRAPNRQQREDRRT